MQLLKCADCGSEISITSEKCPNCGSKKQFKNYVFMRKELVKDGVTPMEMMNFQKHGGKIKISDTNWGKRFKIIGIIFVIVLIIGSIKQMQKVDYTQEDGTVIQVTGFELEDIKREKALLQKENELLSSIKRMKSFQYGNLEKLYEELTKVRTDNKKYKEQYEYYKKINDSSWSCIVRIQKRDKENLKYQDSYEVVAGSDNRLKGWTNSNVYTYVYSYKAKNAFGMESTLTSSNQCTYDNNFNLINIEKKN